MLAAAVRGPDVPCRGYVRGMTIWADLGFSGNLYDSRPLQANAEGDQLLLGRADSARRLLSQLQNSTLHPTLEGPNGVGKTSLVLVTTYRAVQARRAMTTTQTLLPIEKILQFSNDPDRMMREALLAVAQSLISHERLLEQCGHSVANLAALKAWLNSPVLHGGGGGVGPVTAQISREANSSEGFLSSGLEALVRSALTETFPTPESGSLVGVIDNVELVSRSNDARRVLETLRDSALDLPGVRWVLCGALGIIRSCVTSPRLDGRVAPPLEIAPVADDVVEDLINARIEFFRTRPDATAPVDAPSFRHLYDVCNKNLRDALKYAQAFAVWLDVEGEASRPENFASLLEVWLASEAENIVGAISLQDRAWRLFDELAQTGGSCAPSDNERFGFNTPQQMRTNFAALERVSLIKAEVDEDDLRRRTVNLTDKGWVVHYARTNFAAAGA